MPPTHNQKNAKPTPARHPQARDRAYTTKRGRLKCHRNINKITRKHNMTHIHNRPRATKTSPTLRQDATKSWLTYQYDPPNQDRTHNLQHHKTGDRLQTQCPDMMETPSKHHDDTHRVPQIPTAQHEPHILQCQPKGAQDGPKWSRNSQTWTQLFCKSKIPPSIKFPFPHAVYYVYS